MKRSKIAALILAIVMIMAMATISYAYGDYCSFTETEEHDYEFTVAMDGAHPHKGFYECGCGERQYKDKNFYEDCTTCRIELCKKGIHCYIANIHYTDNGYSGYGQCYCGKRKEFSYREARLVNEPYQGLMIAFNKLYSVKHPHYQYDMNEKKYYTDKTIHTGACGVCMLSDDYYDEVINYNISSISYDYDYNEETSYYDDSYEYADESYDEYYEEDYYENETDYEYDSSEDDEFYDWLGFIKELFGNS